MNEFNNRIFRIKKFIISFGGRITSISIFGGIDEWKNVQKKETKNINSEMTNKSMLNF